jgi:hypothetical protein
MSTLNTTLTVVFWGTLVAPSAGVIELTSEAVSYTHLTLPTN